MDVGIIGFGKMGRTFAEIFRSRHGIGVHTKGIQPKEYDTYDSIGDLYLSCDMIILCTPLDETQRVLQDISELRSTARKMVFDICTFKSGLKGPYEVLSKHNYVCSVHPMFGSGVSDLEDQNIILTPMNDRDEDIELVEDLFKQFGANTTRMEPSVHDEIMMAVIGVPYFISLQYLSYVTNMEERLRLDMDEIGGTSYKHMKMLSQSILHDNQSFIHEVLDASEECIQEFIRVLSDNRPDLDSLVSDNKGEIDESYRLLNEMLERKN